MSESLQNLRERLDTLIGPGKLFRSANELAQRAVTLGAAEKKENLARNINRMRAGAPDVQLSTIVAIAKAANISVSDLLADDKQRVAMKAAEIFTQLDSERAATALAMLRGLIPPLERADTPPFARAEVSETPKLVIRHIAGTGKSGAYKSLYDPTTGSGQMLLLAASLLFEHEDLKDAASENLRTAFEKWLLDLKNRQKAVDTNLPESDATQQLIKQTKAAATIGAESETAGKRGADESSQRRHSVKRN